MLSIEMEIWSLRYFLYNILHKVWYILYEFYLVRSFHYSWNNILIIFFYIKGIYDLYLEN